MNFGTVWCDISGIEGRSDPHVSALRNLPVDSIIVRCDQLAELGPLPERIRIGCMTREEPSDHASRIDFFVVDDVAHARRLRATGRVAVLQTLIDSAEAMNSARSALAHVDALLVVLKDDTNIPLELLLAEAQPHGTRVFKAVQSIDDAIVSLGILESGVDGVLFAPHELGDIAQLATRLERLQTTQLELRPMVVDESRSVGMGYRGCIDTADMFTADEGMLVGSTSSGGILVCAEVHDLPYMNLRPFRVNAGAVHSYVWAPGDRTEYITDLRGGARALAVSSSGRARPVIVGRVKIEIRPLRRIAGHIADQPVNVLIQDDWHVRVMAADGTVMNCTNVVPGDELLGYACRPGRHVGVAFDETIEEF